MENLDWECGTTRIVGTVVSMSHNLQKADSQDQKVKNLYNRDI